MVDVAKGESVAEIKVGERPWNPALTPDGRKLYVANGRSNSVSVIDTATRKKIKDMPVGELPWGVVIGRSPCCMPYVVLGTTLRTRLVERDACRACVDAEARRLFAKAMTLC